ncbi:MAG: hypothetical protein V3U85_00795, partial [Hyphomicrobium sp.]
LVRTRSKFGAVGIALGLLVSNGWLMAAMMMYPLAIMLYASLVPAMAGGVCAGVGLVLGYIVEKARTVRASRRAP